MEKVKPDVKIALTHMGYYYDAKHGSNAPGDVSLARNLDKGAFDMIIGGHSHDPICVDDKGVWIKDYQPTQPCKPDFQNGTLCKRLNGVNTLIELTLSSKMVS